MLLRYKVQKIKYKINKRIIKTDKQIKYKLKIIEDKKDEQHNEGQPENKT